MESIETENSLFLQLLGDSPLLKVLDFLLESRELDYSKKEIAESSNVSWNTLEKIWPHLLYKGIVVKVRKVGKQEMFRLNSENELVKVLIAFDDSLLKYSINLAGREAKPAPAKSSIRKVVKQRNK
ncbi:MAG: helix-turn-helix transcriptional regulator [Candidatus Micrarchaeota archaeon]|nr:helix-turn-helix transcriptional regulator [Candidatus Micrarchaeota archaeon]